MLTGCAEVATVLTAPVRGRAAHDKGWNDGGSSPLPGAVARASLVKGPGRLFTVTGHHHLDSRTVPHALRAAPGGYRAAQQPPRPGGVLVQLQWRDGLHQAGFRLLGRRRAGHRAARPTLHRLLLWPVDATALGDPHRADRRGAAILRRDAADH